MSASAAKGEIALHAGFWRRAAASLLDSIVLVIPNTVATFTLGEDLAVLVILVVYVLYFALMHAGAWQATVPKRRKASRSRLPCVRSRSADDAL